MNTLSMSQFLKTEDYWKARAEQAEQQRDELQALNQDMVAALIDAKSRMAKVFNYTQDGCVAIECANGIDKIDKAIAKARGQQS